MRDPHSRGVGSIPIRVTEIAKWRNWYTRDAQNVVPAWACEFDSRLGYLISLQVRQVSNRLSYGRCARLDTETCNLRVASAHSVLISLNGRVRPLDPPLDTAEYANWQSGHRPIRLRRIVARSVGDFAGSTPASVTR